MELLEATPIPWAQGVVSSNLAAPTETAPEVLLRGRSFLSTRATSCRNERRMEVEPQAFDSVP